MLTSASNLSLLSIMTYVNADTDKYAKKEVNAARLFCAQQQSDFEHSVFCARCNEQQQSLYVL